METNNGGRALRSKRVLPQWNTLDYGRAARERSDNPNARTKRKKNTRSVTAKKNVSNSTNEMQDARKNTRMVSSVGRRFTRSQPITCLNYGHDRKTVFPEYKMCSECDIWESFETSCCIGQKKRHSQRYACHAGHTHPSHPTVLKEGARHACYDSVCETDDDSEDSLSDDDDSGEARRDERNEQDVETLRCQIVEEVVSKENLVDRIETLKSRLRSTQGELRSARHAHRSMKRPPGLDDDLYMKKLVSALKELFQHRMKQRKKREMAKYLIQSLVGGNGTVLDTFMDHFRDIMRQNCFTPFKIIRLMDLTGAKVNYQAIRLLRTLELDVDNPHRKSKSTILPPVEHIMKVAASLNRIGESICPFTVSTSAITRGESLEFNPVKAVSLLLEASGLHQVGNDAESVKLSQAIDGSRFSSQLHFVMYGVKINDIRAHCPWTSKPLFSPDGKNCKIQSRNNQIPLKFVMGRETSAIYEDFEEFFKSCESTEKYIIGGGDELLSVPLDLSTVCSDLSATWKGTGVGGACKVKTYFCSCCATKSVDAVTPNPERCARWCSDRGVDHKCYHKDFLTDEEVLQREEQLTTLLADELKVRLKEIKQWSSKCQLRNEVEDARVPTVSLQNNPSSIHYNLVGRSRAEKSIYSDRVNNDLRVRGMDSSIGNLRERQRFLKDAMVEEASFRQLKEEVEYGKKGRAVALWKALNNPPCVLHMHMRMTIKMVSTILNIGLSNSMAGELDMRLFPEEVNAQPDFSDKKRFETFISAVEDTFNTEIFGSGIEPAQWRAPVDVRERKFFPLTIDGDRCKQIVENCEAIIDLCLIQDDRPQDYKKVFDLFSVACNILFRKSNLTNDEIADFQRKTDDYIHLWYDLQGKEGATNYIHLWAAGHVSDFLYRHRNLYLYSNQGWEALNALVKEYYFRRTQRGGGRINKSRLRPIGKWLQRRLVLMLVRTEENMKSRLELLEGPEEDMTIIEAEWI